MYERIKVGVVGVGRGKGFMTSTLQEIGYDLVAVCDTWAEGLADIKAKHPHIRAYTDYEEFLKDDMDVVVLANYFHEHAPMAVKALDAGFHVLSETLPAGTMAELVLLVKAAERAEKKGKFYALAENYPFTCFNQEMRRLYQTDEIGEVMYAEGEYNHPATAEEKNKLSPGEEHWRNHLPPTYYSTHALAPLMKITDTMPVSVIGQSIATGRETVLHNTVRHADAGGIMLCRMNNGAIFRIFGFSTPGHSIWYRFHGTKGAMENERGTGYPSSCSYWGSEKVRVWHEPDSLASNQQRERIYYPEWKEYGKLAEKSGHSGGDFFVMLDFAKSLQSGQRPYMNIYRAAALTSVAILGWRSCLENGKPFVIPDFLDEKNYKQYENDYKSPFAAGENELPCTIGNLRKITPEERVYATTFWERKPDDSVG